MDSFNREKEIERAAESICIAIMRTRDCNIASSIGDGQGVLIGLQPDKQKILQDVKTFVDEKVKELLNG